MQERIENEVQYQEAVKEINKLDGAHEGSEEDKKLQRLYDLVEEYENRSRPETKLFTLKRRMAQYSDKEITVYQKMANQFLEYSRKIKAGEEAERPEFDKELIEGMREWAKLAQEISRLEKEQQ